MTASYRIVGDFEAAQWNGDRDSPNIEDMRRLDPHGGMTGGGNGFYRLGNGDAYLTKDMWLLVPKGGERIAISGMGQSYMILTDEDFKKFCVGGQGEGP